MELLDQANNLLVLNRTERIVFILLEVGLVIYRLRFPLMILSLTVTKVLLPLKIELLLLNQLSHSPVLMQTFIKKQETLALTLKTSFNKKIMLVKLLA